MVFAEQLTMDPADVSVTYSDTDHGLPGTGPGGSRYTVMVTGAITGAATIIKGKLKRVASHMLEAGPMTSNSATARSGQGCVGIGSVDHRSRHAGAFLSALPARRSGPDQRSRRDYTYDHPLATLPKSDSDFGIFYPIMGHMCHMPVVEVDTIPVRSVSWITSRCTIAAP